MSIQSTLPIQSFETLNLHPKLMQAVVANRYSIPTEIQQKAIPEVLNGRDLIASAETGAGKTVAFVLPALQRLMNAPPANTNGRGPRVLILTPTRELAGQINETIANMCKFANFRFGTITGGVPYPPQENLLRRPLDLLVATPGRLMDHMERGRVDFSRLEMFILDEADRMLDMGFVKDMEHIANALPTEHQTLLFSATLEGSVQRISKQFLKNPVVIQLAAATKRHALISQRVHIVDDFNHKCALLNHVLVEPGMWQAIVFTGTKRSADELADDLSRQGITCAALHGDMKQSKRARTLERMHRGQLKVLVATDVAARGLDVKKLSHVINFDMPRSPEDYVHRIGRTGRCGEKGIAVSLVGPKDVGLLGQIERFTGQKLERKVIEGLEPKKGPAPSSNRSGPRSSSSGSRSNSGNRSKAPSRTGFKRDEGYQRDSNRSSGSRSERPARTGGSFDSRSERPARTGGSFDSRSERPARAGGSFDSRSERPARTGSNFGSRSERPSRPGGSFDSRSERTTRSSGSSNGRSEQRTSRPNNGAAASPFNGRSSERKEFSSSARRRPKARANNA